MRRACVAALLVLVVPTIATGQAADSGRAAAPAAVVRVNFETQFRYVSNASHPGATRTLDDHVSGFQLRRARLVLTGSLPVRGVTFRVRPTYDRALGTVSLDDAWVAWAFGTGWSLQFGQFKPVFLREEYVSGFQQLAAERSYVADYFTIDYTQGVELSRTGRRLRPSLAIHDGSYGANTDFTADRTRFAVNGRLEWLASGTWAAFSDFNGWASSGRGLMVGAAVDYENGEPDSLRSVPSLAKATLDVTAKVPGADAALMLYAQRFNVDQQGNLPSNLDPAHQWGVVVQAGVFPVRDRFEVYGRAERLEFDGAYYRNDGAIVQVGSRDLTSTRFTAYTAGVNWYVRKHSAKLTLDVVVASDPVPVRNTGGGLVRTDGAGQTAVRAQAQFRF